MEESTDQAGNHFAMFHKLNYDDKAELLGDRKQSSMILQGLSSTMPRDPRSTSRRQTKRIAPRPIVGKR